MKKVKLPAVQMQTKFIIKSRNFLTMSKDEIAKQIIPEDSFFKVIRNVVFFSSLHYKKLLPLTDQ